MFNIYSRDCGNQTIIRTQLETIYKLDHIILEDCTGLDYFKLFIEFTVPANEYYQETCMSFIKFFSEVTRIQDKPIFIIKSTDENYFVTALYPCSTEKHICKYIRYKAQQSDTNNTYNIDSVPKHYKSYKPLPTIRGTCWLLDADGKEYKGNAILNIDPCIYFRQIIDKLPDISKEWLNDPSLIKIMKELPVKPKPFPLIGISEESLEAQIEWFTKKMKEAQIKWFTKKMKEALENPKEPVNYLYLGTSSSSFQNQANTGLDIIGLETPLPHPELPRESLERLRGSVAKYKKPWMSKKYKKPPRTCQLKSGLNN